MLEGRKRARTTETIRVRLSSEDRPLVGESCSTQNVSFLGARLITKLSWVPDSCVTIKSSHGDFFARARVVYCRPFDHNSFAVGLEFFVRAGEL